VFTGTITGLNWDDLIDLKDVQLGANTTLTYSDDGSGSGLLTVSDGTHSVQLHLVGTYNASDFVLGSDGQGGLLLTNDVNRVDLFA